MPYQEEEGEVNGEEGHKLGVRGRHTIAFPIHLAWALLFNIALQPPINSLTAQLTSEHERDLCLSCTPYQGGIGDAETLGDQSKPGAEVGYTVGRVLYRRSKSVLIHVT